MDDLDSGQHRHGAGGGEAAGLAAAPGAVNHVRPQDMDDAQFAAWMEADILRLQAVAAQLHATTMLLDRILAAP